MVGRTPGRAPMPLIQLLQILVLTLGELGVAGTRYLLPLHDAVQCLPREERVVLRERPVRLGRLLAAVFHILERNVIR